MFKRNEGILDRIVRVALGMVLLPAGLFWFSGFQGGILSLLAAGLGLMGLITGLTGVSILYIPFGISTLEKEKELIARCASMAAGCMPNGHSCAGQRCGPPGRSPAPAPGTPAAVRMVTLPCGAYPVRSQNSRSKLVDICSRVFRTRVRLPPSPPDQKADGQPSAFCL